MHSVNTSIRSLLRLYKPLQPIPERQLANQKISEVHIQLME